MCVGGGGGVLCVCVRVCVCVCVCARVCLRACMCVCRVGGGWVGVWVWLCSHSRSLVLKAVVTRLLSWSTLTHI